MKAAQHPQCSQHYTFKKVNMTLSAGNKIARRLAEQGCTVAAWNRNVSKAQALSEAGIAVHDSAQQAIQDSDIVLLMLSDASAIHDVLLNSGDPVDLKGKIIIQMGTIGQPALCSAPFLCCLCCLLTVVGKTRRCHTHLHTCLSMPCSINNCLSCTDPTIS